jgi:hypothetical protein
MAYGPRRHRIELAVVTAIAAVAIALFAVGGDSVAVTVAASAIASCAGVLGISLVFYEIGRGEDEARAQGWRSPYDREPPEDQPVEHEQPPRQRIRPFPRRRDHG